MHICTTISELRKIRGSLKGTLGFIPTMGYLHAGHIELVRQAKKDNAHAIVSIFVNPTQFGPTEDLATYPRKPEDDLAMLREASVDVVFLPSVEEMYPANFQTFVEVAQLSQGLEGARRPGSFRGVATVVSKLFHIVEPDTAYFGQKDAQQVAVIQQMIADLAFPIQMHVVPTVREKDGLAMSSRNSYLTPEQRRAAPILYQSLQAAEKLYKKGERSTPKILEETRRVLATEPLAEIDYVRMNNAETLEEITEKIQKPALLSMAVKIGKARLIDNITFATQ